MDDLFGDVGTVKIHPARKFLATVAGVFAAGGEDFVTAPVECLELDFEGIVGDVHHGATRRSGSREPWYPRGTQIRNERQLSVVAVDELATVASAMGLERIAPEWIGANLLLDGLPRLSMLPAGTLLFFRNGVTLKVDAQNGPCRDAGRAIARHAGASDPLAVEMQFPKAAKRLRGLVVWVEKPGTVTPGEAVSVRVPEQWIYGGGQ